MEYVAPLANPGPGDTYRDRNIGAGIIGSVPSAAAIEHPLRELVHLIEHAGLVPAGGDLTQVRQAVDAKIAAALGALGAIAFLDVAQTFTKPQRAARLAVAYAASLTLDFALAQNFVVGDLAGNITLNNPDNAVADQCGVIVLKQDGTGGRQLALGANFVTEDDEAIEIALGAGQETHLRYWAQSAARIVLTPILNPS